jgi:hypothetical protein
MFLHHDTYIYNDHTDLVDREKAIVKKKKIKKKKKIVQDAEMIILDSLLSDKAVSTPLYPQTARPRLSKHYRALSKLIRNKKSAITARVMALGFTALNKDILSTNIIPSSDTLDSSQTDTAESTQNMNNNVSKTDISDNRVLSLLYSAYLSTAKGLPKTIPPSSTPLPPHPMFKVGSQDTTGK